MTRTSTTPLARSPRRRRALAAVVLGASSTLMVGCSAADVSSFFSSVGITLPSGAADNIAAFLTRIENAKHEHERPKPCPSPTTAPTTAAPTTTVVVNPTTRAGHATPSALHGGCERRR